LEIADWQAHVCEVSICRRDLETPCFTPAGLLDCLKKTVARGGPMALYQGFGVSVQVRAVGCGTLHACQLDHQHTTT
jgi:hypothetical protein